MSKLRAITGGLKVCAVLLMIVTLAGCGGSKPARVGSVELAFIDASDPTNTELALIGQVTLAGQTVKINGSQSVTFSGINYGTYTPGCVFEGYQARPTKVKVDRSRVQAEVILVPDNDTAPPSLMSVSVINADGELEPFFNGAEVFRLSGFEFKFSEYIEPVASGVITISSPLGTISLGPDNWQLSPCKLSLSPSCAYDSGAQSFSQLWEPGVTYTISLANLADYAGNPFAGYEFTFTGSPDEVGPAAGELSARATEIGQQILLEWEAAYESDLWGYQVFRRHEGQSEWIPIADQLIRETFHLDDGLTNGLIYEYKLRAVDLNGNLGLETAPISATPASPNRGIVAFASDRLSLIDSVPDFDLYLKFYSAASSAPAVRIEGLVPLGVDSNEDCPAWSPDGRRLAYTSTNNAMNPELCIAELDIYHDGREVFSARASDYRQLTFDGNTKASPTWSPSGKEIAFIQYPGGREAPGSALMVIDAKGGSIARELVNNGRRIEEPDWRPQGDKIVYCTEGLDGNWELQAVEVKSKSIVVLSSPEADGDDRDPAYSPDGARIAFSSTRGYGPKYDHANIWVMDADGGNVMQITTDAWVEDSAPVWSPDGTQLIFARETADQPVALYRVAVSPGAQPVLLEETVAQPHLQIPAARNWLPVCAK